MRTPRIRVKTWQVALALATFGLLASIVADRLVRNASLRAGHSAYDEIKNGMTVVEVGRLMRTVGPCMGGQSGTSMIYHSLDGTYTIGIIFQPGPNRPASWPHRGWRLPDDWVACEKDFVELGRGGGIDDLYVGLRLRAQRIADRE